MRRYFTLLGISGILTCFILCYCFFCKYEIIGYHLIAQFIFFSILLAINILTSKSIKNIKIAAIICNSINAAFFAIVILFYLLVIGSNYFWKRTITYPLLKTYFPILKELALTVPVEPMVIAGVFVLFTGFLSALFIWSKPSLQTFIKFRDMTFPKTVMWRGGTLILIAVLFVAFRPSRHMLIETAIGKRIFLSEEPVMQFGVHPIAFSFMESTDFLKAEHYTLTPEDKQCLESVPKSTLSGKTVVVITVDALRADHLPMYGYNRNTAPFLNSLYKSKKIFKVENAFSSSYNTPGGTLGILFSRNWSNFSYTGLSLLKYFQLSGYNTYTYLTGYFRNFYGLSSLFINGSDHYYESGINNATGNQNDNDKTTLAEIQKAKSFKNSFLYIHLLSTHITGMKNDEFRYFRPDKIGMSADKKTAFTNNHDNGIVQADFMIKGIFEKLKQDGVLDNSLIVITADHGDLLGDEGMFGHEGMHKYVNSIPILIYDKNPEWYTNKNIATNKDIAPTITQRIFGTSPSCWDGRSLHEPFKPSTIQTISAQERSPFPRGILHLDSDTIKFEIFNDKSQLEKISSKYRGKWLDDRIFEK